MERRERTKREEKREKRENEEKNKPRSTGKKPRYQHHRQIRERADNGQN